jgi:hypothetical protein
MISPQVRYLSAWSPHRSGFYVNKSATIVVALIHYSDKALKGTWHEIFDLCFFHKSTPPRPIIHGLKPFWIWLRIREENPMSSQRCQWHVCAVCSRVRFPYNNSVLNYSRRCSKKSWLHSSVNDTAVQPTLLIIFTNSKPYSKRL